MIGLTLVKGATLVSLRLLSHLPLSRLFGLLRIHRVLLLLFETGSSLFKQHYFDCVIWLDIVPVHHIIDIQRILVGRVIVTSLHQLVKQISFQIESVVTLELAYYLAQLVHSENAFVLVLLG